MGCLLLIHLAALLLPTTVQAQTAKWETYGDVGAAQGRGGCNAN